MELKYLKQNFDVESFVVEAQSLQSKISGYKHENSTLIVYLSSALTEQEKIDLANLVEAHVGNSLSHLKPVSARQIRTALIISGISISNIETALNGLPEPNRSIAQVAWEFSNDFYRDNPLILELAPIIGLTEQQLNDLWALAATL